MLRLSPAVRSLLWPTLDTITTLVVGIVSVFLIARLIGAEAFGLGALAQSIVLILYVAVNSVVHDAMICQDRLTIEDVDSAFTASLIIGLSAAFFLALAAPSIGSLLDNTRLPFVIWAFLPLLALSAISVPLMAERRRALDFAMVGRQQIAGRVIGTVIGAAAALDGAGVWSLVVQQLTTAAYTAAAMLILSPHQPRFRLSWHRLAPMLAFCRHIIFSQLILHGIGRLFIIAMGAWHGLATAGYWGVATRFSENIVGGATQGGYNVALAHLGRLRGSREQLAIALDKAQNFSMLVMIPVLAALAAAAEPLIQLLLGASWAPTADLLLGALLGTFLLLRRMLPTTALRAIGHSHFATMTALADGATVCGGLLLFGHLSPIAIAIVCGVSPLPGNVVVASALAREFGRPISHGLLAFMRDLTCGLVAIALGHALAYFIADVSPLVRTIFAASVAFLVALLMIAFTQPKLVNPVVKQAVDYLRQTGKKPA